MTSKIKRSQDSLSELYVKAILDQTVRNAVDVVIYTQEDI